jgi:hypothetical protein
LQRVAWALLTLSACNGPGPGLGPLLSGHPSPRFPLRKTDGHEKKLRRARGHGA